MNNVYRCVFTLWNKTLILNIDPGLCFISPPHGGTNHIVFSVWVQIKPCLFFHLSSTDCTSTFFSLIVDTLAIFFFFFWMAEVWKKKKKTYKCTAVRSTVAVGQHQIYFYISDVEIYKKNIFFCFYVKHALERFLEGCANLY